MVDCEHCEQRELVAVDPLDELISLGDDILGTLSVIMDFYREHSLERNHQALVPIVDDEAGTASDELAFDIVTDLRNPVRQDPIRGVVNRGVIGTTARGVRCDHGPLVGAKDHHLDHAREHAKARRRRTSQSQAQGSKRRELLQVILEPKWHDHRVVQQHTTDRQANQPINRELYNYFDSTLPNR